MSYAKTVLIAIGLGLVGLIILTIVQIAWVAFSIHTGRATGVACTRAGVLEGLLVWTVLGFVAGTAWYFFQRR
jgi:hypothetical protein